ncbi:MAG: hypothetical protein ACI4O5_06780 [Oscillospiraceae bacterium]
MNTESTKIVWLDEQALIASFHPVDGYRRYDFHDRESLISFLLSLQVRGYRFQ